MSRGFVKEDDQEDIPLVPQRAHLPAGVTNFVTPDGMRKLLEERQALTSEKNNLGSTNENEKRIALNFINAKLQLLDERIATARVVNPEEQPGNEIRFGAHITLIKDSKVKQTFQIVGVDEADVTKGKLSFISPLSRLMINKKVGDKVVLKQAGVDVVYEITGIKYQG